MKLITGLTALFIIFNSGCSVLLDRNACDPEATRIYEKDNTFQVKIGPYYASETTNLALSLFEEEWSDRWGDSEEARDAVNNMCIVWEPYPFELENGGETEEGLPQRFNGVTESADKIRVYISEEREIAHTAFIHELVHVMLWKVNDEPDPDHEKDVYDGWTQEHNDWIRQTNSILGDLTSDN